MTPQQFADRMNRLTPEEIAQAMESLPTDVLEFAVRFEALSHPGPIDRTNLTTGAPSANPPTATKGPSLCAPSEDCSKHDLPSEEDELAETLHGLVGGGALLLVFDSNIGAYRFCPSAQVSLIVQGKACPTPSEKA